MTDSSNTSTESSSQVAARLRVGVAPAALTCALLGVCVPYLGFAAIVLGVVQLAKIRRAPGVYGARGLAIAGICIGLLGAVLHLTIDALVPLVTERSLRAMCADNLRRLNAAMKAYWNENPDWNPRTILDFRVMIDSCDVVPRQFMCPSSGHWQPDPIDACYVYISGAAGADPRNVVFHERKENHAGAGGNVLFADGHVEFITPYAEVEALVRETKERLRGQQPAQP